ncbi:MAG: hypothetical protein HC845_05225 [Akkermansiaceae bacterium]|nr:hypothetical protein [Akkermansiaceae bacterium]
MVTKSVILATCLTYYLVFVVKAEPQKESSGAKSELVVPQPTARDISRMTIGNGDSGLSYIHFNGKAIAIMSDSIIKFPEKFKDRTGQPPKGTSVISIREFLVQNRGWITSYEVTVAEAIGEKPLSESAVKMLEKSSNVVVATYNGNPIAFKKGQINVTPEKKSN